MSIFKNRTRKEPIIKTLPIPMTKTQEERYRRLQNTLDKTKRPDDQNPEAKYPDLHELARERLDILMDEVELELAKSS